MESNLCTLSLVRACQGFYKNLRKAQPEVFPPPVFLNLWPETKHESCLDLRWFILLACCVDSWACRLFLSTVSFSALKYCTLVCDEGVRLTQVPEQNGKNAVVAQLSKGWWYCYSCWVSCNTVSRLGFEQRVKFHVWPIHVDADPLVWAAGLPCHHPLSLSFSWLLQAAELGSGGQQGFSLLCANPFWGRDDRPRKDRRYQV